MTDDIYVNEFMLTNMVNISQLTAFLTEQVSQFLAQHAIPYTKVTKKSEISFDLKDSIYRMKVENDQIGHIILKLLLRSSSSGQGNLKPMEAVSELFKFIGTNVPEAIRIVRYETYGEKDGKLVPLLEV